MKHFSIIKIIFFLIIFFVIFCLAKNSNAATTIFSDGFENGLGNWSLADPAIHWQSSDFAHTGSYSHRIQDIGTLGEIAGRNFQTPLSRKLYLSFWWMLSGSSDTGGKLGRFIGTNGPNMEIWWSNEGHSIAVHHYNTNSSTPECDIGTNRVHYTGTSIFDNNWHHFEVFLEYNTPGIDDGRLRIWLDRPENYSFSDSSYLKVDHANVRFMNSGACEIYYNNLRLPTNLDARMQPGFIYYDDVEIWDDLPVSSTSLPSAPSGLNVI